LAFEIGTPDLIRLVAFQERLAIRGNMMALTAAMNKPMTLQDFTGRTGRWPSLLRLMVL
jgi:hypothetical protein